MSTPIDQPQRIADVPKEQVMRSLSLADFRTKKVAFETQNLLNSQHPPSFSDTHLIDLKKNKRRTKIVSLHKGMKWSAYNLEKIENFFLINLDLKPEVVVSKFINESGVSFVKTPSALPNKYSEHNSLSPRDPKTINEILQLFLPESKMNGVENPKEFLDELNSFKKSERKNIRNLIGGKKVKESLENLADTQTREALNDFVRTLLIEHKVENSANFKTAVSDDASERIKSIATSNLIDTFRAFFSDDFSQNKSDLILINGNACALPDLSSYKKEKRNKYFFIWLVTTLNSEIFPQVSSNEKEIEDIFFNQQSEEHFVFEENLLEKIKSENFAESYESDGTGEYKKILNEWTYSIKNISDDCQNKIKGSLRGKSQGKFKDSNLREKELEDFISDYLYETEAKIISDISAKFDHLFLNHSREQFREICDRQQIDLNKERHIKFYTWLNQNFEWVLSKIADSESETILLEYKKLCWLDICREKIPCFYLLQAMTSSAFGSIYNHLRTILKIPMAFPQNSTRYLDRYSDKNTSFEIYIDHNKKTFQVIQKLPFRIFSKSLHKKTKLFDEATYGSLNICGSISATFEGENYCVETWFDKIQFDDETPLNERYQIMQDLRLISE